ncbi:MAG: hypothetical protein HZB16_09705 [Armatimonadetes bacterium]|nr:hypothetical protein [Armatimonadota bacterium]
MVRPALLCLLLATLAQGEVMPDSISPNAFAGTDSERISQAIAASVASGASVVIPRHNARGGDVWLLDRAILLPSNTTLVLDGCRLRLSDRCRDNWLRSANCGLGITDVRPLTNIHIRGQGGATLEGADHPRATGDSAKTLGAQTYGTDAGVATESQKGDWRNIGILLANVDGFGIEGLLLRDSHCWAISLEGCSNGLMRDLRFESTGRRVIDGRPAVILNQDGIDLRQGCHDILIDHVTGYTGDDLIALTAIPHAAAVAGSTGSTMVSAAASGKDAIHHVIIRNVIGHCAGGHHIVRFLNTSGARLHDVVLDGLLDTSGDGVRCRAAVKIGDNNPVWGGVTPLGDTSRITLTNITSRAVSTILVAGSLADSVISNVLRYDGEGDPVNVQSGPDYLRRVQMTNVRNVSAEPR